MKHLIHLAIYSQWATFLHDFVLSLCLTSLLATFGFFIYLAISPFVGRFLTSKTEKNTLLFLLVLFVLPYQIYFLKIPDYYQIFGKYIQWTPEIQAKAMEKMYQAAQHQYVPKNFNIPYFYQGMVLFSYVWLIVFLFKIVKTRKVQKHFSHAIHSRLSPVTAFSHAPLYQVFLKISTEMKCQKVKLYVHPAISTPMLVGILHPKVILPETYLHSHLDDISDILVHELNHYKQKDLWIKGFGQFLIDLQWFNPVLKWLFSMLDFWSELVCDQLLVKELPMNKRISYAQNILSTVKQDEVSSVSVAKLGDYHWKGRSVKTRLGLILQEEEKGNKLLSTFFFPCFSFLFLVICLYFGKYAPRIDSIIPYVSEIYPNFVFFIPEWIPFS